ncbi:MAG TPA: HNH endonuclease [Ktedonobacteraceae bacterium]|nr:HNH endonuclease [Ktedonobacteraceae bacterium]
MIGEQWRDPINVTKEQWMALLENQDIIKEQDIELLRLFYKYKDCKATSLEVAQLLHMPHHAPINRQVSRLGKRIVEELNISAPKHRYGDRRGEGCNWWNVPFWGETKKGGFYWILRPELQEAMRELAQEEELAPEIKFPEEVDFDGQESFYEGAVKQVYVNRYERSRSARDRCVEIYGSKCSVCGFDFAEKYGEVGKDIIHVHHLVPLSQSGKEYKVDPENDLRPVCANCHVIIHQSNPPYSIDEVKAMLAN